MLTIARVINNPKYLALSVIVTLTVIAFVAWLPNLHLITQTMTSSSMTIWQKTNLLTSLLGSLQTNFTPLSQILTLLSATLAGIQASLLVYYVRQVTNAQQFIGISLTGLVSSMFGVGCASCGSVLLTSFIGFSSTITVLGILPFRGQEFGLLGIGILMFAIRSTIKKINHPSLCEVKQK